MVFILSTQQECQTIRQVDTPKGGNTAMKGCWWSQVIQLPYGGEMPPIRLAGCRETQAWTYAKTIQIVVFIMFCCIDKQSSRVRFPTEPLSLLRQVGLQLVKVMILPTCEGRYLSRRQVILAPDFIPCTLRKCGLDTLNPDLDMSVNYPSVAT